MKNHAHPEFKGSRRSRKDPMVMTGKTKDLTKKSQSKRPMTSTTGPHAKSFGHH